MNTTIRDDFVDFTDNEELYNSDIKLYDSQGGTLKFEGKCIYDKKPQLVENEDGQFGYQGHKSMFSISLSKLTFLTAYSSLKGYYAEITDNVGTIGYKIINSSYDSTVSKIFNELEEETIIEAEE